MTDPDDLEAIEDALGKVLEQTRKSLGLTRAQAAAKLRAPVEERTLWTYERGERRPSFRKFLELAEVYGVSPVWLIREAYREAGRPKGCPSCGKTR